MEKGIGGVRTCGGDKNMSGPKSSSYRLTAQQMAILREQQRLEQERRLEQQRMQEETRHHDALLAGIERHFAAMDQSMERAEQVLQESGKSQTELKQLQANAKAARVQLKKAQKKTAATSQELHAINGELQAILNTVAGADASASAVSASMEKDYRQELQETIQTGFSLSFAGIGMARKRENVHLKRINEILAGIGTDIPAPLKERFVTIRQQADAITDAEYLENFCSVVVTPFARDCRDCAGYDDALSRYCLLAGEAHVAEQNFACTREGLAAMEKASAQLEEEILADRERTYINEALDAAMREMGYELVGDRVVRKKTGKHVRHELYSLKDGTAVDVTYADNGQISMELGGIGNTDRSPTAEEGEQLVEDMQSFCKDYATLERKLAERGVTTVHISHMPPSAAYAQIFNANDYEMTKPVEQYQANARRRRTQQGRHME